MADNNATRIILSAVDQTGAAFASINKGLGNLQSAAGALGPVLGGLTGALSAGAFVGFVKGTIDAADGLRDMSQRIGIGIKDLAGWTLAANQSGTSMESVAKGVKTLSVYMVEHREKLKAAGITATDANGAMVQLADLFAAMPDGIEKTALAAQLFGKAGGDMIAMLNLGSKGLAEAQAKAAAYGKKLEELAPKADEFNDLVEELALNSKAAGMNIADYLLPGLIGMAKWFNDVASGGEKAQQAVEYFLGERGMKALVLAGHPMLTGGGTRSVSGRIGGAGPKAMTLAEELALGDANSARLTALGLLDKPAGGKAGKSLIDVFDNGSFLTRDKDTAKSIRDSFEFENWAQRELLKDTEREAAEAVKLHTHYLKEQLAPLEQHTRKLEEEVATYGMTVSQIEAVNLQRLEEARNIAAENGAFPEHLAYLDQEIELRRRLVAAAGSKEALDANKKATEEMRRDWERMHEQVSQSLTDEIMKGGKDAGELLEDYFRTLVLRPAIQGVVNVGMNAVGGVLDINAGESSGSSGIGSLLSSGSSIYNAATGGGVFGSIGGFGAGAASAASELALGASFVGPSASLAGGAVGAGASAGLAAGSSGAASALSGLAAAAPWVAGGLAIASIFGGDLFGKKKPAPIEWGLVDLPRGPNPQQYYGSMPSLAGWASHMEHGPFGTLLTTGQHLSRNGMSAAALQSQVTSPLIQLDNVLAGYLSEKEKNKISMALYNGREGEHGWSQGEVEGVMMRRLDRISNAIGGWVDKLADSTTGNLQERYTQLAQILSIRGDEFFEKLAQDMFRAYGSAFDFKKFSALSDGVMQFKSLFYSEQEKFDEASATVKKALADLNLTLPESRDGFRDLVEGIDTGTKSGFKMYESLIALAPAMDGYYAALQSELDVKRQLTAMNEDHFSTVEDFRRYQRVSQNYDAAFAGDYAYNIQRGAIQPGGARYGDMVSELRALRTENQAQAVALATAQQETARILRRWNGDGMPAERVVA